MLVTGVGRNAPCPCGSGKKYKNCCMRRDQALARAVAEVEAADTPMQDRLAQVREITAAVAPRLSEADALDIQATMAQMEEIVSFNAMTDRIDAAVETLPPYRSEFVRLLETTSEAIQRADALFAEDRFAPLRCSAEDLRQACEEMGLVPPFEAESDEAGMETTFALSMHFAGDEKNRMHLSRQLMMALPDYVDAGRYVDAWLIHHSAEMLVSAPESSSPFAFTMVLQALEEWTGQLEAQRHTLLDLIGLDGLPQDLEEAEALVQTALSNPKATARLERFLEAHPALRGLVEAEAWRWQDQSIALFERDDADCLYLSEDEVNPWITVFFERLLPQDGTEQIPHASNVARQALPETTREMAAAIFTPQRIEQLVSDLKAYRHELIARGEKDAAGLAHAALMMITNRDADTMNPADEPLLLRICMASLREVALGVIERSREEGEA